MASVRSKCIPQWKKCDACQAVIGQNDYNTHLSSHCPPLNDRRDWIYGHIFEKKFFSFVKVFETQDERTEVFFNNTVQISLAVAQLCDLPIGDPVLITAKNNQSVVKSIWPVEENTLSSVFLTIQSLKELDYEEGPVEVKKFEKLPYPAREISLELIKPQHISDNQISEMKFLLSATFVDKIIVSGQYLVYYYYGMYPRFKVINVKSYSSCDSVDTLTKDMAGIEIEENNGKLYRILPNTLWRIKTSYDDENKKSCSEKYCLSRLGGISNIIDDLKDAMYNVLAADITKGQHLSCGILLHGISGTGKTYLAKAMIAVTKLPVIEINSWEIISNFIGDGENRLKALFDDATARAPSIILMDELQSFCPSKSSLDHEKRLLGYLLILLDKLLDYKVVVIGITRDLESVNAALRRPGRFDYEIELPVPNANARVEILQCILKTFEHDVACETIVQLARSASHGFVGADLFLACTLANTRATSEAKLHSTKKVNESQFKVPIISNEQLIWAFSQVKPSAMREILVEVPNIKWTDIGGQEDLKLKLQQVLEWPLKHPESFVRLGITPPRGILLFGPPGCSKTMIAKAVATESQLNFISVKGAELFSKWVGDSEKAVREVFRRARSVAPSVVFFDEIDAITAERETNASGGSNVQERVLSQLLTELDGVQPLENVTIIAATNRPDRIDSALLRPGRLDRKLYVPLPSIETRKAIFSLQFTKTPISNDVDVERLVESTEGYSGAEIIAICSEAGIKALQENLQAEKVDWSHFSYALSVVKPRTPESLLRIYEKFAASL